MIILWALIAVFVAACICDYFGYFSSAKKDTNKRMQREDDLDDAA